MVLGPQVNELFMEPNYFFSHKYKQNQFFQGETKITRMIERRSCKDFSKNAEKENKTTEKELYTQITNSYK